MPRLCGRLSDLPGARSAQLFKDFDFLAPQKHKILLARRDLPLGIGNDWVLAL